MNARNTPAPKRVTDWARIERQYRAGLLSILEIAREHRIPESNIRYHAQKNGWKRDLTDEMRARARTKLVENLAHTYGDIPSALGEAKAVSDDEIIEQAARTQVNVVREHQHTLGAGHRLTMRMLGELEATTTTREELEDIIRKTVAPKRQQAMLNMLSLGNRAAVMRDLATAARLWVTLERQAFGIADDRPKDNIEQRKLDEMTSDQLREEIRDEAKKLGLSLSNEFTSEGVAPKMNGKGNGITH